jgi:predicted N-acetyltransferase YhbS
LNDNPSWPGRRLGLIGGFHSEQAEATETLLDEACSVLAEAGCSHAVGPVDGSTWAPYRFAVEDDGSAPFVLEPTQPSAWPAWWRGAGFIPWQRYRSTIHPLVPGWAGSARGRAAAERLRRQGIRWRPIEYNRLEQELRSIHAVSAAAFTCAPLSTPISVEAFLSQALATAHLLDDRFVYLAEDQGTCCGFVFALPDHLQARRGEPVDRLVVKTLAVLPGKRYAGLGLALVETVERAAVEAGLRHAIHALMHEHALSNKLAWDARVLRRYALFERRVSS